MPRKKKSPPEFPATEPVSLASPLDAVMAQAEARRAEQLEAPPPPRAVVATPEAEPVRHSPVLPEPVPDNGHADRVRPEGPRTRHFSEPRTVFAAPAAGFKLGQTPQERLFKFDDDRPPSSDEKAARLPAREPQTLAGHDRPPSSDEKAALQHHGFSYRSVGKVWAAPSTPEVREASDLLALRLSGKAANLGYER